MSDSLIGNEAAADFDSALQIPLDGEVFQHDGAAGLKARWQRILDMACGAFYRAVKYVDGAGTGAAESVSADGSYSVWRLQATSGHTQTVTMQPPASGRCPIVEIIIGPADLADTTFVICQSDGTTQIATTLAGNLGAISWGPSLGSLGNAANFHASIRLIWDSSKWRILSLSGGIIPASGAP